MEITIQIEKIIKENENLKRKIEEITNRNNHLKKEVTELKELLANNNDLKNKLKERGHKIGKLIKEAYAGETELKELLANNNDLKNKYEQLKISYEKLQISYDAERENRLKTKTYLEEKIIHIEKKKIRKKISSWLEMYSVEINFKIGKELYDVIHD